MPARLLHRAARLAARKLGPLRRLHDDRNRLLSENAGLRAHGMFSHYASSFDAPAVMRRHQAPDLRPDPRYLTNFLGVRIDPKFLPAVLDGRAGQIEPIPIPANWHADIAEWGAALRAVDLAQGSFTVIELGCGWGCWINNTGVAARSAGLAVQLIGVEGDAGHLAFAREAVAANGFAPEQVALTLGIAAAVGGTALFPRQAQSGIGWGLQPIFGASAAQQRAAVAAGSHDALPMVALADCAAAYPRIDLLHVDIQGGEVDLIAGCLDLLAAKMAYLLIGTHSRQIEGRLFDLLVSAGWRLEIERPAVLSLDAATPTVYVDGVQGWRNPRLLPE